MKRTAGWLLAMALVTVPLVFHLITTVTHNPREHKMIKEAGSPVTTDYAYTGPLPWQNDPRFRKFITDHGTPILMAAYRAALPDPILNEAYNIALAADTLAGTVVQPGEVFSQNRRLGPYTADRGYREGPTYAGTRIIATCGGGVCKIASLLYNVAVLSNLEVVERSPHSMTVPYVPPGQDATVYYGQYDFRFRNNTGGPIVLWADTKDNALYMAAYGRSTPPRVIWHHQTLKRIPAPVEYRFNPGLAPGTEKVVMPGQEGVVVRTWITIQGPGGRTVVKQMGVDSYDPNPRVIERGPAGIRNT